MNTNLQLVRVLVCIGCAISPIFTTSTAHAVLTAYEPFNYADVGGDLNGQSGGGSSGFSDAWSGNTSFNVGSGSLLSPVTPFLTSGNSETAVAFGSNREIMRSLASPLGTEGTTRYLSFLMRPEGILHQGAFDGWFGLSLRGSTNVNVVMTSFGDKYTLEVGGTASATAINAVVGQTVLFVLRMDFTEGVDPVRLYLNPQPGAPEPGLANASQINLDVSLINQIFLTGPGAYSFDELRIGTTYADVTPVPEPSTLCTAIFATCVSFCCKRRIRLKTAA
jgi:hypothetical protein